MKLIPLMCRQSGCLKTYFMICFGVCLSGLLSDLYAQEIIPSPRSSLVDSDHWSWKLLSHSMHQSKVGIFFEKKLVRHYQIDCNLANHAEDSHSEEASLIEKLVSNKNPNGLLLITCIQGAHSKLVEVYNPAMTQDTPVFSQTGAYYAGWLKRDEQLFIYYDQACKPTSKNCQRYERVEVQWPNKH
jgi:hypothetical protein